MSGAIRLEVVKAFMGDAIRLAVQSGVTWREGRAAMRAARMAMRHIDETKHIDDATIEAIARASVGKELFREECGQ